MQLNFFLYVLIIFLSACSDKNEKADSDPCKNRQSAEHYIVLQNNGTVEKVNIKNLGVYFKENHEKISRIEPDYKIITHPMKKAFTSDLMPQSLSLNEATWERLGVYKYHNLGYYGQGVTIAVLDTGVYTESPYLKNRITYNTGELENGKDDDGNGLVDDLYGWNFYENRKDQNDEVNHGTQIAHLIVGQYGSAFGEGVAPGASILPVDIMGYGGGSEADAIHAIDYAISRGAQIINNSWSISCSITLKEKYNSWLKNNILMVHAAGNEGYELNAKSYNSSNYLANNYISVGSVKKSGLRTSFSNYGPNIKLYTYGNELYLSGPFWKNRDEYVSLGSGTSYSAAIVSGAAALIWSRYPSWTASEVKAELYRNSYVKNGVIILRL